MSAVKDEKHLEGDVRQVKSYCAFSDSHSQGKTSLLLRLQVLLKENKLDKSINQCEDGCCFFQPVQEIRSTREFADRNRCVVAGECVLRVTSDVLGQHSLMGNRIASEVLKIYESTLS